MSEFDIALVTYAGLPHLTVDDQRLAAELRARGLRVRAAIWSDATVDWSASPLAVMRSTWDYFRLPEQFLAWLAHAEQQTRIVNSPACIRWNHDKHYLKALHERGIPIVPTLFVKDCSSTGLANAVATFGTSELVIKPAIGGAAWRARRFAIGREHGEALAHLEEVVRSGSAMIQPFLGSVLTERERSLVYFDGAFSHAYLKTPFSAGTIAGETSEISHHPSASELELAAAVLGCLDDRSDYARIDMASLDGRPHLMELELIEPALHFDLAPGSEARLADALERRLESVGCASPAPVVGGAETPMSPMSAPAGARWNMERKVV